MGSVGSVKSGSMVQSNNMSTSSFVQQVRESHQATSMQRPKSSTGHSSTGHSAHQQSTQQSKQQSLSRQHSQSSKHRGSSIKEPNFNNIVQTSTQKHSPDRSSTGLDSQASCIKINDQFSELLKQSQGTKALSSIQVATIQMKDVEMSKIAEAAAETKAADDSRKAKTRLETICKLLGTPNQGDSKMKMKHQETLAAIFEEIVFA